MKKICLVISALLVITLFAACASGAKQQDTGATAAQASQQPEVSAVENQDSAAFTGIIEPEQLISKEEAVQLAGAVNDGEKKEQPAVRQKIIFYDSADGEGFLQISLSQDSFMTDVDHTSEDIYLTLKEGLGSKDAETVDGIGSEYFFGTPGLHILYKGYYIVVAAGKSSDLAVRDILKRAGALAVSNLDKILSK